MPLFSQINSAQTYADNLKKKNTTPTTPAQGGVFGGIDKAVEANNLTTPKPGLVGGAINMADTAKTYVNNRAQAQTPDLKQPSAVMSYQPANTPVENIQAPNITTAPPEPAPTTLDDDVEAATRNQLTGDSPDIQNMRSQHERSVARMRYEGMAEARAMAAQKGYTPGSPEYNQLMRNAQEQISQAELGSQQQVFEGVRGVRREALKTASDLSQTIWDRERTKTLDAQTVKTQFLSNIKDDNVRNMLLGMETIEEMQTFLQKLTYPPGTKDAMGNDISGQFKSGATEGLAAVQTRARYVIDAELKAQGEAGFDPNNPEHSKLFNQKVADLFAVEDAPLNTGVSDIKKQEQQKAFDKKVNDGDFASITDGEVKQLVDRTSVADIPSDTADIKSQVAKNGGYLNIDGKVARIVDYGGYHKDRGFIKVEYPANSGKYFYSVDAGGQRGRAWFSTQPRFGSWKNEVENPFAV